MATTIYQQPRDQLRPGIVEMSPLATGVTLSSRVTPQSPYFFKALGVGMEFLNEPVSDWSSIPAFMKFSNFVHTFPLHNDAMENAVKRTSDFIRKKLKAKAFLIF